MFCRNCGLFVVAYVEFLSDGHQMPFSEFDSGLHHTDMHHYYGTMK